MNQPRVPWRGRYPAAVALALLALCPFLILSTATQLLTRSITDDLGATQFGVQLAAGLANAGYSLGAVACADLIQRVPGRGIFLACEAGFVVGSLLTGLAPGIVLFVIGRSIQGLATGMLLVAALPPLVTNHGVEKLPLTAAFVNLGLFGLVTLGPTIGGITSVFSAWRPLVLGIAVLGLAGLVVGILAFDPRRAPSPGMGFDFSAIPVAAAATVLPFLAVSLLSISSFQSPAFLVPLTVGLAALLTLVVRQYRKSRALMPVRMLAHTLPVTGVSLAMVVGCGFTTLIELAVAYLVMVSGQPPLVIAALLATQVIGITVAAMLFKRALRSRWLPLLAFLGLVLVAAGGVVLLTLNRANSDLVIAVAGVLLGFGAGAGVAPGLFMAGLSVPSNKLGPTFALVELLRAEAAFLVGPVLLRIAMSTADLAHGIWLATLITVLIVITVGAVLGVVLLLGGARPHAPDLRRWLDGEYPGYHSPRVAAVLRG